MTALELARAGGLETAELVERARHALRAAGDRALSLNAFTAAAGHFERALELWPESDRDRALLLFGRARARAAALEADETELREAAGALVAAGRHELAAEAEFLLGERAWYAGDRAVADDQLRRALELVEPLADSRSKAWILSQASRMAMLAAQHEAALVHGRRALELAEALDLPEVRAHALNNIGTALIQQGNSQGFAELEQSAALARELNSPELARSLNNLSTAYGITGRVRDAENAIEAAIAAAERFGLERSASSAGRTTSARCTARGGGTTPSGSPRSSSPKAPRRNAPPGEWRSRGGR